MLSRSLLPNIECPECNAWSALQFHTATARKPWFPFEFPMISQLCFCDTSDSVKHVRGTARRDRICCKAENAGNVCFYKVFSCIQITCYRIRTPSPGLALAECSKYNEFPRFSTVCAGHRRALPMGSPFATKRIYRLSPRHVLWIQCLTESYSFEPIRSFAN